MVYKSFIYTTQQRWEKPGTLIIKACVIVIQVFIFFRRSKIKH